MPFYEDFITSNSDLNQDIRPFWLSWVSMIHVVDDTTETGASHMLVSKELQHYKVA